MGHADEARFDDGVFPRRVEILGWIMTFVLIGRLVCRADTLALKKRKKKKKRKEKGRRQKCTVASVFRNFLLRCRRFSLTTREDTKGGGTGHFVPRRNYGIYSATWCLKFILRICATVACTVRSS